MTKYNNPTTTSNAPGQLLGYSLQTTRFAKRLLEVEPGTYVSLEVFEDVGVTLPDGNVIAEQDKSSTSENNPVSDRAKDFWKTLSNWIDAVQQGKLILEKTKFEIYVSRPVKGKIVTSFSDANTLEEAKQAFRKVKEMFKEENIDQMEDEGAYKYIKKVIYADEATISKIIKDFSFTCGSGSPSKDLMKVLENNPLTPPELKDDLFVHILGWIKSKIDPLIENNEPAVILADDFRADLQSYVRAIDCRTVLTNFAKKPTDEEIKTEENRTYVLQLEAIECDFSAKLEAINDYLSAAVNRTRYAKLGLVNKKDIEEFQDGLIRTWKNKKSIIELEQSNKSFIEKGKYLYLQCSIHNATLAGKPVPIHFVPGSFHVLSDDLAIGWHPNYKNIISK